MVCSNFHRFGYTGGPGRENIEKIALVPERLISPEVIGQPVG